MDLPNELYREANCAGIIDPSIFDEQSASFDEAEAKRLCASCQVSKLCLGVAIDLPDSIYGKRHYIWGGMTESERQQLTAVE